jgi:hypothetical protein
VNDGSGGVARQMKVRETAQRRMAMPPSAARSRVLAHVMRTTTLRRRRRRLRQWNVSTAGQCFVTSTKASVCSNEQSAAFWTYFCESRQFVSCDESDDRSPHKSLRSHNFRQVHDHAIDKDEQAALTQRMVT